MVWRRQNKKLVCKPIRHWEKKDKMLYSGVWLRADGLRSHSVLPHYSSTVWWLNAMLSRLKEFLQSWNLSHLFKKPKVLQSSSFTRKSVDKTGIVKRRSCKNFAKVLFWIHETRLFCWFRIGSHCFIQVLSWTKESPQKLPREPGSEKWWKV